MALWRTFRDGASSFEALEAEDRYNGKAKAATLLRYNAKTDVLNDPGRRGGKHVPMALLGRISVTLGRLNIIVMQQPHLKPAEPTPIINNTPSCPC